MVSLARTGKSYMAGYLHSGTLTPPDWSCVLPATTTAAAALRREEGLQNLEAWLKPRRVGIGKKKERKSRTCFEKTLCVGLCLVVLFAFLPFFFFLNSSLAEDYHNGMMGGCEC